jgi:hypothetical protein
MSGSAQPKSSRSFLKSPTFEPTGPRQSADSFNRHRTDTTFANHRTTVALPERGKKSRLQIFGLLAGGLRGPVGYQGVSSFSLLAVIGGARSPLPN